MAISHWIQEKSSCLFRCTWQGLFSEQLVNIFIEANKSFFSFFTIWTPKNEKIISSHTESTNLILWALKKHLSHDPLSLRTRDALQKRENEIGHKKIERQNVEKGRWQRQKSTKFKVTEET